MAAAHVELLAQVPLFADLDRRDLEMLAGSLKERIFDAGETVAMEGQHGVGFFVIEDGDARVTVRGEERGHLGPGDYFGEIALIAEGDRSATVVAEGELRCLGMTFWDFKPFVEENPKVAWKMLEVLVQKLRRAEQQSD